MGQREVVQFRTPQHPSLGTNHWGGASPFLARNIPKESLELRYLRLNTVRSRDEIFPAQEHDFNYLHDDADHVSKHDYTAKPSHRIKGFLTKLYFFPRKEKVVLGLDNPKKNTWFPRWDPANRWPQGFCWFDFMHACRRIGSEKSLIGEEITGSFDKKF